MLGHEPSSIHTECMLCTERETDKQGQEFEIIQFSVAEKSFMVGHVSLAWPGAHGGTVLLIF